MGLTLNLTGYLLAPYNDQVRKRIALFSLSCLFVFLGAQPAFGQLLALSTPSPAVVNTRSGIDPSPKLPGLSSLKILLVQKLGNQLANRIEIAISRFHKLITRVQSRVAKIEAKGEDVRQLKNWITSMTINLETAQTALMKFRGDLSSLTSNDDPQKDLKVLQLDIKMTKDALTATQTTLKQTVVVIASVSAVSTPSRTNGLNL